MALDSEAVAIWAVDVARADAPLAAILGAGTRVHRDPIPRGIALPAIAIGIQASGERTGAIKSGPNTHTATIVRMRTTIQDIDNYIKIKQAADRLDLIFDGRYYQSTAGVYVWSCVRLPGEIPRHQVVGDITYRFLDIFWEVVAKAT